MTSGFHLNKAFLLLQKQESWNYDCNFKLLKRVDSQCLSIYSTLRKLLIISLQLGNLLLNKIKSLCILKGLRHEYNSFVVFITSHTNVPNLDEINNFY